MTTDIDTKMQRCLEFLRPLARPAEASASNVHWVSARNADPDQGENYCRSCCQIEVDRLNAERPGDEYFVDGCGPAYDNDGSGACSKCGHHLRVCLTDHGVQSELEHWSDCRIDLRGEHGAMHAFELAGLLESAYMDDVDSAPWLRGYKADRTKAIQRDVRKLLRRIDAIRGRMAATPPSV